jgi:flavin-dependent dehydrogenase
MTVGNRYDVIIAGGGLAGLCLSIQLRREMPDISILVVEKSTLPAPRAAHKVGESSVEGASHYFRNVLGLTDLLSDELPKFGLRFLASHGDNTDMSKRLECGPSHFLPVPSFQIDRGQFENGLARRAKEMGVHLVDCSVVRDCALAEAEKDHRIDLELPGGRCEVHCRWLVDTTGRSAFLKKRLGLAKANRHNVNAAWFRIDHPIDLDDWSDGIQWGSRLKHSRRLSTNHLLGEGYWVWLIPLAGDRTSVGIVAADSIHPFAEISSFEKALSWLDRHEPQCAAVVRDLADRKMDFLALKNYSHDVKQMFSADRWCLAGESGVFVDPFYSPGSDFVGMANSYVTDLIVRDSKGEDISLLAEHHDKAYRSLGQAFLVNYRRQYPLMGNPWVITTKIVWDITMYWAGTALLFSANRLCDQRFTERVRPIMQRFAAENVRMQAFFRDWAAAAKGMEPAPGAFVDYAELGFLANLNAELLHDYDDDSLYAQFEYNLRLAEDIKHEIVAEVAFCLPSVAHEVENAPRTEHLSGMFAEIRPPQ